MNAPRVVVAGGGIAGLVAAYTLQQEASQRRLPLDLVCLEAGPEALDVTPVGRMFVRNVCMVFDRYLRARTAGASPVFSRTV